MGDPKNDNDNKSKYKGGMYCENCTKFMSTLFVFFLLPTPWKKDLFATALIKTMLWKPNFLVATSLLNCTQRQNHCKLLNFELLKVGPWATFFDLGKGMLVTLLLQPQIWGDVIAKKSAQDGSVKWNKGRRNVIMVVMGSLNLTYDTTTSHTHTWNYIIFFWWVDWILVWCTLHTQALFYTLMMKHNTIQKRNAILKTAVKLCNIPRRLAAAKVG